MPTDDSHSGTETKSPKPTKSDKSFPPSSNNPSTSKQVYETIDEEVDPTASVSPIPSCVVCGDESAKMHYGVMACLGCKGFFRRALKKANQYECLKNNQCRIDKFERNSCRSCRLQKCLDAGMDPNFVRPDRDFTGKQHGVRLPALAKKISTPRHLAPASENMGESNINRQQQNQGRLIAPPANEDWPKKLPVEMRTLLMNLLNIEAKIARGDTIKDASEIYPLHINTIKEIIDEPVKLRGKRTEMRYEPYRMAKNEELSVIVYRRLIAAIDWVEFLADMMQDGLSTEDRITLVKSAFAPLMLFKCSAKTAVVTEKENLLCLCNFAYVPRNIAKAYSDTYHLDNGLVCLQLTI